MSVDNSKRAGYNWRSVLGDFAATSGVLAGFTITMVVFILGWSIANTPLFYGITWANIGVLLNGIASALFITALQFFLGSKEFDMWALPEQFERNLREGFEREGKDWSSIRETNLAKCSQHESRGRRCYNLAVIITFLAVFFVIGPYNICIATLVSGLGIALEVYQWFQ